APVKPRRASADDEYRHRLPIEESNDVLQGLWAESRRVLHVTLPPPAFRAIPSRWIVLSKVRLWRPSPPTPPSPPSSPPHRATWEVSLSLAVPSRPSPAPRWRLALPASSLLLDCRRDHRASYRAMLLLTWLLPYLS